MHVTLLLLILHAGATALYRSFFGKHDGIFYITNLRCSGSESRLTDCSHSMLALTSCGDGQYAGVKCLGWEIKANCSVYT